MHSTIRTVSRAMAVLAVSAFGLVPPAPAGQASPAGTHAMLRPPARYSAGAAFDVARGVLVMFGGYSGGALGDTWEWNGSEWRLAATSGPTPRNGAALAYDPIRQRVVLFGGDRLGIYSGETWEWDGVAWTRVATTGPPARTLARLVFDPVRSRLALFGGLRGTTRFGDLWEWDGSAWSLVANDGPARFLHGMAADSAAARFIVFGGNRSATAPAGNESGATWVRGAGAWESLAVAGPGARDHATIARDPLRDRVVLYGGAAAGDLLGDLWEFDGSAWTNRAFGGGPGPRANPALVFDPGRGVIVLYGGFDSSGPRNDLWAWDGAGWRQLDDETVGTLVARFDAERVPGGVLVRWEVSGVAGIAGVAIERADAEHGPWRVTAAGEPAPAASGEWLDASPSGAGGAWYRLIARGGNGETSTFGPIRAAGAGARMLRLEVRSATPAAPPVRVDFDLPETSRLRLSVHDVQGRTHAVLADGEHAAGRYQLSWDGRGAGGALAPGVYFARLETRGVVRSARLVLAR